jgi:virion structural protein
MGMRIPPPYQFDPTGELVANRIVNEQTVVTHRNFQDYHFIVPTFAPFFEKNFVIRFHETGTTTPVPLVLGKDYYFTHHFQQGSLSVATPLYGSITLLRRDMQGIVSFDYNTLGGDWLIDDRTILKILADRIHNPKVTYWDQVAELPYRFPVTNHDWNIKDMYGSKEIVASILEVEKAIVVKSNSSYERHIADRNNPHGTTKRHIGLSNVLNLPILPIEKWDDESDDYYMTPRGVYAILNKTVKDTVDNNHRELTLLKAQVNTLVKAGVSQEVIDKLVDYFNNNPIGNAERIEGLTVNDILAKVKTLKDLNAAKLGGKSYDEIVSAVKSSIGNTGSGSGNLTEDDKKKLFEEINSKIKDISKNSELNAKYFNSKTYSQVMDDVSKITVDSAYTLNGYPLEGVVLHTKRKLITDIAPRVGFPTNILPEKEGKGVLVPLLRYRIFKKAPKNVEDYLLSDIRIKVTGFSTPYKGPGLRGTNISTFTDKIFEGFTEVNGQGIAEKYNKELSAIGLDNTFSIRMITSDRVPKIYISNRFTTTNNYIFNTEDILGINNTEFGGIYYKIEDGKEKDPNTNEIMYQDVSYFIYMRNSYRTGTVELLDNTQSNIIMPTNEDVIDLGSKDLDLTKYKKALLNVNLFYNDTNELGHIDSGSSYQYQLDSLRAIAVRQNNSNSSVRDKLTDLESHIEANKSAIAALGRVSGKTTFNGQIDSGIMKLNTGNFFNSNNINNISEIPSTPTSFTAYTNTKSIKKIAKANNKVKIIRGDEVYTGSDIDTLNLADERMLLWKGQVVDSNTVIFQL